MYTSFQFHSHDDQDNDSMSTIAAMRRQEDTGYTTIDYLALPNLSSRTTADQDVFPRHQLDATMRGKMVTWCYQVADFCKFRRETVEIAVSHLDRFLSQKEAVEALNDLAVFQLAAMTCLYTAVKIHEPEVMDTQLVANLGRGAYSVPEIEAMESHLLMALQWRLNPPTTLAFAREFLQLLPEHVLDQETLHAAYELTKYQAELAVGAYGLVTVQASTIAYCSLINAMQSLGVDNQLLAHIAQSISSVTGIDGSDGLVLQVRNSLYESVARQSCLSAWAAVPDNQHQHLKNHQQQQQEKHLVAPQSKSDEELFDGTPHPNMVTP